MKSQIFKFSVFAIISISCLAVSSAWAEEENRMAKGALVGAGTNVIGGAVLDSLDGSSQPQYVQSYGPDGQPYWQQVNLGPQEDPNRTILKRAVQGAVTGAVAAEFSGSDGKSSNSDNNSLSNVTSALSQNRSNDDDYEEDDDDDEDDDDGDRKGKKKSKSKVKKSKHWDGHRPPGWDRGKKVGWGGGDVPPGHQDDIEHPEVEDEDDEDSWWKKFFGGKNDD